MKLTNKLISLGISLLALAFLYYTFTFGMKPQTNITNEHLIENPYNDSQIYAEVEQLKKTDLARYFSLLNRIEVLENELNLTLVLVEELKNEVFKEEEIGFVPVDDSTPTNPFNAS